MGSVVQAYYDAVISNKEENEVDILILNSPVIAIFYLGAA
jgi:hypothetical protein